ncbi:MAG: hypothetical protein A2469_00610 [Candidatus Magasanikbacteria bacterium RIFOXYC2_FULL_40_16]|uniref:Uncharacterized protein n=1 Tax=Candidatus Magasanikbacteria bacterium RIFOXYC2_FULL_40_16 TaxID=1798703 RepID=A0A1F6P1H9_9BACT|nr:MAG: hypothetical protein A2469_00610 [Candidatus Magasanikbacteria bacterium RIFOXYC2_FULL_40_16]
MSAVRRTGDKMTIRELEAKIHRGEIHHCNAELLGVELELELADWESELPSGRDPYAEVVLTNDDGLTISPTDLRW